MALDYTSLVTSQYRDKPRFAATVALLTQAVGGITDALASMPDAFDVDLAVGAQLDAVGLWVGISRRQPVPLANAYFSFDVDGLGWDEANWATQYDPVEGIVLLDDDTYRSVIKAKIGANYWDGSVSSLNAIAFASFADEGVNCYVVDNQDMSVTIYILGNPSAALLELIKRGVTPPRTAGVLVAGYVLASVSGAPFFALDAPTGPLLAGLDFGHLT